SGDGKSVYVQVSLAGNQGQALANKSVEAVRSIVERSSPPPGVQAYVTGPAPLVTDMNDAGNSSIIKITVVTIVVIFTMLLFVYRSVVTVILLLIMV
ncbi:MMPL family transporter, partial [Mycobacteroides abscessus]